MDVVVVVLLSPPNSNTSQTLLFCHLLPCQHTFDQLNYLPWHGYDVRAAKCKALMTTWKIIKSLTYHGRMCSVNWPVKLFASSFVQTNKIQHSEDTVDMDHRILNVCQNLYMSVCIHDLFDAYFIYPWGNLSLQSHPVVTIHAVTILHESVMLNFY